MPRKALFTKEEIVEKALDLVRRKGLDALTARELGAALGSSSRPIFTLYNNMEEVNADVKKAAQQLFSDYVADVNDYTPAFKEFGLRLVRFAREEQNLFNLLFFHKDADVSNEIHPKAMECLDVICSDYGISKEQAIKLFGQLWVFVCGLALLSSKDPTFYFDELVSEMISLQFVSTLSFLKSGKPLVSPTPHLRSENEKETSIIEYLGNKSTINQSTMKKTLTLILLLGSLFTFAQTTENQLKLAPAPQTEQTQADRGEGLIRTHWTQDAPYNKMCPRDPVTNSSSYAGCPAVAMGQIINYLRTTQGTRFDDSDDYRHNYAGRNYDIDDDWETIGFPSFETLNQYLDEADELFAMGEDATNDLAAAIVFACGTACTQVYTSSGSGTFYVEQAYDAYKRFGFDDCVLYKDPCDEMYDLLIDNLQNGYPAHLAVESPDGQNGHNVVVDGYREDGYFHMNFGYGGSYDGWYLIPDPDFFYNLTELEGIILNIIPKYDTKVNEKVSPSVSIYPNPSSGHFTIEAEGMKHIEIFNALGQCIKSENVDNELYEVNLESSNAGIYLIRVLTETGIISKPICIQ